MSQSYWQYSSPSGPIGKSPKSPSCRASITKMRVIQFNWAARSGFSAAKRSRTNQCGRCRGLGVFMAEQFLNGSKVVARFEQMGDSAELVGEFGLLGV